MTMSSLSAAGTGSSEPGSMRFVSFLGAHSVFSSERSEHSAIASLDSSDPCDLKAASIACAAFEPQKE